MLNAHTLRILIDTENTAHSTLLLLVRRPRFMLLFICIFRRNYVVVSLVFSFHGASERVSECAWRERVPNCRVDVFSLDYEFGYLFYKNENVTQKSDSEWSAEWDNNRFIIRHTWPSLLTAITNTIHIRSTDMPIAYVWRPKRNTKTEERKKEKKKTIQIHSFDLWFGLGSFNCEMEPKKQITEKLYIGIACVPLCGNATDHQQSMYALQCVNVAYGCILLMSSIGKLFTPFPVQMVCDGTHFTQQQKNRRSSTSLLMNESYGRPYPFVDATVYASFTKMQLKILSIFICGFRWVDWKTTSTASMTYPLDFKICIRLCDARERWHCNCLQTPRSAAIFLQNCKFIYFFLF